MRGDLSHGVWAVLLVAFAYAFATSGAGGFGYTLAAGFVFLAVVQVGMWRNG
jgi:hypothetical protein